MWVSCQTEHDVIRVLNDDVATCGYTQHHQGIMLLCADDVDDVSRKGYKRG